MSILGHISTSGATGESRVEEGRIRRVDTSTGTCEVSTSSGRRLERVRIATPMGAHGTGLTLTPRAGAGCLVVYFVPDSMNHAYLLSTFQDWDSKGRQVGWGAPGDFSYEMESGGHVLFSQGGVVDVMSDPWCRVSMLPDDQKVKAVVRNVEVEFSPLSAFRITQDEEAGRQYMELLMNSRFLSADDESPDIIMTIGRSGESERTHAFNPESDRLFFFQIEDRAGPIARRTEEIGRSADGDVHAETTELNEARHRRRTGDMDGVVTDEEATQGEATRRRRTGLFDDGVMDELTFTLGEEERVRVVVKDTGEITISNPSWDISVSAETNMTISNQETEVVIDGGDVYIGGRDGAEPMVLGNQLKTLLTRLIDHINSVKHKHPQGPTLGPIVPFMTSLPGNDPAKILSGEQGHGRVNHVT